MRDKQKQESLLEVEQEKVQFLEQRSANLLDTLKDVRRRLKEMQELQLAETVEEDALKYDARIERLTKETEQLRASWNIVDRELRNANDNVLQLEGKPGINLEEAHRVSEAIRQVLAKRTAEYQAYAEEAQKDADELSRQHEAFVQTGNSVQQISPTMAMWHMKHQGAQGQGTPKPNEEPPRINQA